MKIFLAAMFLFVAFSVHAADVKLTWEYNQGYDVFGYRVYYGKASGIYIQTPGAGILTHRPFYVIKDFPLNGDTYYFVVTSVDKWDHNVESIASEEVSVLLSIPPNPGKVRGLKVELIHDPSQARGLKTNLIYNTLYDQWYENMTNIPNTVN